MEKLVKWEIYALLYSSIPVKVSNTEERVNEPGEGT